MKKITLKPGKTKLEAYRSVRKPCAGVQRAIPSKKGYKRPQGSFRKWID